MNYNHNFSPNSECGNWIVGRVSEELKKLKSINELTGFGFQELVRCPMIKEDVQFGAAVVLSVLCYPNADKISERIKLIDTFRDFIFKYIAPPRSELRKEYQKNVNIEQVFSVPNKRIQQTISKAMTNFNKRMQAAAVLWTKFASSKEPTEQNSLNSVIELINNQNSEKFTKYVSSDFGEKINKSDFDDSVTSFRQKVMSPSRPVFHLAMALYEMWHIQEERSDKHLYELVVNAEQWLPEFIYKAELYRMQFGLLFPKNLTKSQGGKFHNVEFDYNKSVCVLPLLQPLDSNSSYDDWYKEIFFAQ
tara:strand:- start:518 stop:1432 length:915 start_codon:yes stop_codon:yes gene_type:complete